jgi:hypothetical protein
MVRPPWAVYRRPSAEDELATFEFASGVRDREVGIARAFPGPEPRGGRMAACVALHALTEQQIPLFPDLPWRLGAQERCEYEYAAYDAMKAQDRCGDCGARIGEVHTPGCDLEQCGRCGHQWLSCGCPIRAGEPRRPWRGWQAYWDDIERHRRTR